MGSTGDRAVCYSVPPELVSTEANAETWCQAAGLCIVLFMGNILLPLLETGNMVPNQQTRQFHGNSGYRSVHGAGWCYWGDADGSSGGVWCSEQSIQLDGHVQPA
ncbi:hypothetical protein AYI68_g2937, partial [Smittium mucronatum]